MPQWIIDILIGIVPRMIAMFFSDLQVRQQKLDAFNEWVKTAMNKGSQIADSVDQTKAQADELKKKDGQP